MVRYYKRQSHHNIYDDETVFRAVQQVRIYKKTVRKAAREFNMNFTSLQYHLNRYKDTDVNEDSNILLYKTSKQVFSSIMEEKLVNLIIDCAKIKNGLSSKDICDMAYKYALEHNINIPRNWKISKRAGRDWFISFQKRHPILSENNIPSSVLCRQKIYGPVEENKLSKKTDVEYYIDKLKNLLSVYNFKPEHIYCMSEIGMLASNRPNRILIQRTKIRVENDDSIEEDKLLTMATTVSASGSNLPPFFIFPSDNDVTYHKFNKIFSDSENHIKLGGWMDNDLFLKYLQYFISKTKCSPLRPRLLILVKQSSYCLHKIKTFAEKNGIVCLTIPCKLQHKLQPLEAFIISLFKIAFNNSAKDWVNENPEMSMKVYHMPSLISKIYSKVFCVKKIQMGFQITGLYPFNDSIIKKRAIIRSTDLKNKFLLSYSKTQIDDESSIDLKSNCFKIQNFMIEDKNSEYNYQIYPAVLDEMLDSNEFTGKYKSFFKPNSNKETKNKKIKKYLESSHHNFQDDILKNDETNCIKKLTKDSFKSQDNNSCMPNNMQRHLRNKSIDYKEDNFLKNKAFSGKSKAKANLVNNEEDLEEKKKIIKEIIDSITKKRNQTNFIN